MKKRLAFGILGGVLLFCALMLATCGAAIFPATTKLTKPLWCPADTREAVVVTYTHSSGKGGTSTTWDMYCIDAEGGGTKIGAGKLFLGLTGIYTAGLGGLFVVLLVGFRLRKKSPGGRA